ncbi:MAG: hypothetical protein ACFNZR_00600 [Candidatus Nanosynbacter sp.]
MNNYCNILFPEIINKAFPILDGASYIRQLASLVPFCPDTAFHLFSHSGQYFVLVMTDYPDPLYQSEELKQISGEYEFEFTYLIRPYTNNQHIEIRPNDDIDNSFFVPDPKSYYRYYLAAAKQKLDR